MILQFAEFIATLAAGLFTRAAIYINWAEHPARMECGTELAATVFAPSYKRASVMQVILALVSTLGGFVSWMINGELLWLIGAILIFFRTSIYPNCYYADQQETDGSRLGSQGFNDKRVINSLG